MAEIQNANEYGLVKISIHSTKIQLVRGSIYWLLAIGIYDLEHETNSKSHAQFDFNEQFSYKVSQSGGITYDV